MRNKFKPISISLSPNVEKDDVLLALKLIFQPWKWKKENTVKEFEENCKNYLGVKYAVSFNSGRSAFYAILKALELEKGSDVLMQAFTCNAVPNPILWAGLNPVYLDCDKETFNINKDNLKEKIARSPTPGSSDKILVVQHTFGLPANMDEIMKIAEENNIPVIEDCAHSLGAEYKFQSSQELENKKVGTFGKAAFFSFSRDKVISSVYGGMAVTNDDEVGRKLEKLQKEFGQPGRWWICQQLRHPILLHYIVLPLYKFFDLGKFFLVLSQWLKILSKAVSWQEKRGLKPRYFPKALPAALAILALNQFKKLDKFNNHRKVIARYYFEQLKGAQFKMPPNDGIFLRFALQHPKAHQIIYDAWHKENILLGDWYTTPIAPDDTRLEEMKYEEGSCPKVEELSKTTLNLPTHINISVKEAQRIVNFLKKYDREG